MILEVISTNPPPFKSDPKVIEWVHRHAEVGHEAAKVAATEEAIKHTHHTYEQQLTLTKQALKEDLEKIRAHHLTILKAECKKGT